MNASAPKRAIIAWALDVLDEDQQFCLEDIQYLNKNPAAYTIDSYFISLMTEAAGPYNF